MTRQQKRQHARQQAKRNIGAIAETPLKTAVLWAFSPHSWRAAPVAPEPAPAIAIDCNQETVRQTGPLHDAGDDGAGVITRQCTACKESKPLSDFGKAKARHDGLANYCKVCTNVRQIARRVARGGRRRADMRANKMLAEKIAAEQAALNTKYCPDCHEQKPKSEYGITSNGSLSKRCMPCTSKRNMERTYGKTPREKDAVRGPKTRPKEKICEGCRKSHEYRFYKKDPDGLFGISDYCVLCSTIMAVIKGEIDLDPYPHLREAGVIENYPDDDYDKSQDY